MEQAMQEERAQKLTEKMSNLRVGQEDLCLISDVQLRVKERLIQSTGHFFKYNVELSKNILIKEGLFLCIDKVVKEDSTEMYLIHVVDPTGEFSYCRTPIADSQIQMNSKEQLVLWVG